jgi:hypothetical protein
VGMTLGLRQWIALHSTPTCFGLVCCWDVCALHVLSCVDYGDYGDYELSVGINGTV